MINIEQKPAFSLSEAQTFASRYYGLVVTATELPSERDQNFLLVAEQDQRFILKIANPSEDPLILNFENEVLTHVAQNDSTLPIPRVIRSISGRWIEEVTHSSGATYLIRVITYLPGKPMALMKSHSPELLNELGRILARLDRAMVELWSPVARRSFNWSVLDAAETVGQHVSWLDSLQQRLIVEHFLARFEAFALPELPALPTGLIHNDGNDYNILLEELVSGRLGVSGLIDFGDFVWGPYVYEPAITAAYAISDEPDPLLIAGHILAGYHEVSPLNKQEVAIYIDLISIRLCTTVVLAAKQRKEMPKNEYLSISEEQAWQSLERLIAIEPNRARQYFQSVCGYGST